MHRILTFFLGFYWLVQFALLAIAGGGGASPLDSTLNFVSGEMSGAVFMIAAGLAAVMFLWLLFTIAMSDEAGDAEIDDVARFAFTAGTGVLTLFMAAGASDPERAFAPAIPLQLGALLASYVAARFESGSVRAVAGRAPDELEGARLMARGAARNANLSRLSGRPNPTGSR